MICFWQGYGRLVRLGIVFSILACFVPTAAARAPLVDERGVMTMAPILEKATPAVISISVATRVPGADNPLMRDPFFRRYFGLPDSEPGPQAMSAGSGVIVDAANGHVVTNHHVIRNAERITVTVKDGRQLKAELVGSDAATDIALLKVDARGLSAISLGDSDRLKVGDVVLAIGNPFGLGQTVTSGIVSARHHRCRQSEASAIGGRVGGGSPKGILHPGSQRAAGRCAVDHCGGAVATEQVGSASGVQGGAWEAPLRNSELNSDARYWRNRAHEVRLAALGMQSPAARLVMIELADAYLRLVEHAHDRINFPQHPTHQDELQSRSK